MRALTPFSVLVFTLCCAAAMAAQLSPCAGQDARAIKALSDSEIDDLVNGRGMGLAKAGELNGYPGPIHVLDMGAELDLSQEQRSALAAIKERMSAAAKPLGSDIIARERALDEQFASGSISKTDLATLTSEIGTLQARLRAVHLTAHLETKDVLSAAQIARYNALRGYDAGAAPMHEHMMKGHGG
jgi:Spy/CpxP family protein refolding chaperone